MIKIAKDPFQINLAGESIYIVDIREITFDKLSLFFDDSSKITDSEGINKIGYELNVLNLKNIFSFIENPLVGKMQKEFFAENTNSELEKILNYESLEVIFGILKEKFPALIFESDIDINKVSSFLFKARMNKNYLYDSILIYLQLKTKFSQRQIYLFENLDTYLSKLEIESLIKEAYKIGIKIIFITAKPFYYTFESYLIESINYFKNNEFNSISS
jgi:hypothetical protein